MAGVRIPIDRNSGMASWFHHTPKEITPEVSNYIKSKQIAFAKGKRKRKGSRMNTKQAAIGRWAEIFKYFGLPGITGKNHFKGECPLCGRREIPL
jgi:hypothetical protein